MLFDGSVLGHWDEEKTILRDIVVLLSSVIVFQVPIV